MFKRIIVPLDGSKGAEQAIPTAARITRASKGSIIFVSVVLPPVEFGTYKEDRTVALKPTAFEKRLTGATDYLTDIVNAHESDLAGIDVVVKVVSGAASPAIFSAVNMEHGDLIVMCSHEESGLKRWMFGSVALEAVRHSPVPVLVLNEHSVIPTQTEANRPLHILVVLDGSALAETAIEPAAQLVSVLAAPAHGALHLLRVVDIPTATGKYRGPTEFDVTVRSQASQEAEAYLKDVTDRFHASLAGFNLTVTSSAVVGTDVVETILQQAEQADGSEKMSPSDLIAMTTHGHTGLLRLIMGNVTEKILNSTKHPLLVVRHHDTKTQGQQESKAKTSAD
jgi:nucleotide-binding universal stress UspA family protein